MSLTISIAVEIACTVLPTEDNGPLWLLIREMAWSEFPQQDQEKGVRSEGEREAGRDIINATYIRWLNEGTKGMERIFSLLWKCHSQAFYPSTSKPLSTTTTALPFGTLSHYPPLPINICQPSDKSFPSLSLRVLNLTISMCQGHFSTPYSSRI